MNQYEYLSFHGVDEEDEGEQFVEDDSQAEDHIVENEDASLIREVSHDGFEVGVWAGEVVADCVGED